MRYLRTGKPRVPGEAKTRGIVTYHDISTQDWSEQASGIRVHIWDFGGQHIMQGTRTAIS